MRIRAAPVHRNAPLKTCPRTLPSNPVRRNVLLKGRNDGVFLREAGETMVCVNQIVNQIFNHFLNQFSLGVTSRGGPRVQIHS